MTGAPHRRWIPRLGAVLSTAALVAVGAAAGLWLGSPAVAATPPLQVQMAGESGFSTGSTVPLVDIAALAPGGAVSGSMRILDDSDTTSASDGGDTVLLRMVRAGVLADCDARVGDCQAAGEALRDALRFDVTASSTGGAAASPASVTVTELIGGIPLASGLVNGDVISLDLAASLPDRDPAADNQLQYGRFGFDLALDLDLPDAVPPGGSGPGPDSGGTAGVSDSGGSAAVGDVQVGGVSGSRPGPPGPDVSGGAPAAVNAAQNAAHSGVLVLGQAAELSYTGAPIRLLLAGAAVALAAGLALLAIPRRRSASAGPTA